jgi:hypothetical protein
MYPYKEQPMRLCFSTRLIASVAALPALLALNASATIVFDDGLLHVIDAGNSFPFECAEVDDGPLGETTTLDVPPGGEIGTLSCRFLDAYGFSEINMLGGLIPSFRLHDDSFLFYSVSHTESLSAQDNSTVFVISGRIGSIASGGTALVEISDGIFFGSGNAGGESTVNIHGGEFGRFDGTSLSTINVFGGTFLEGMQFRQSAQVNIYGGDFPGNLPFWAGDTAIITFFGSDFNFPFGDIVATSGILTGTLSDGTPLDVDFVRDPSGTITLPEPNSLTALGSGVAMLALLYRRRRYSNVQ